MLEVAEMDVSTPAERVNLPFLCFFVLFRPLRDLDDAHWYQWERSLLNLLIQMLICSGDTLTDIHRHSVLVEICVSFKKVKLTCKIKHHNRHLSFIHSWLLPDNYARMETRGGIKSVFKVLVIVLNHKLCTRQREMWGHARVWIVLMRIKNCYNRGPEKVSWQNQKELFEIRILNSKALKEVMLLLITISRFGLLVT